MLNDITVQSAAALGLPTNENGILAKRPYISTHGKLKGKPVVAYNTGQMDNNGQWLYSEKLVANATLRHEEWINLEDQIIEAARERLVIIDDLQAAGLTFNTGGLGTIISEWETASEMTDAEVTMDGESKADKDAQNFGMDGVPIPVIQKPFSIGERMLLASRQRGSALDVTQGIEASRAVSRKSESIMFYGASIGKVKARANDKYDIPGVCTFDHRGIFQIKDWTDDDNVTPENIFEDILAMVRQAETEERRYGPFTLYIPGVYAYRFRQDFKEYSDKTLMQRVTDEDSITRVRVSDALKDGDVVLIEMSRDVIDLGIGSDITTIQWASGSGWTNHFQVFAAWAPRLKKDYDGHCGIIHGTTVT